LFDHLPYPWPQRAARAYETLNQQSLQSVHGDLRRHHIIDSGAYHLVHPCNLAAPASFDLAQLVCFFPHRPLGWILTQLDLKGTDAVLLQVLLAWARRLAKGNQNWPSPVYARWSLQLVGAIEFD
jgi:streptomycin 6-kinase